MTVVNCYLPVASIATPTSEDSTTALQPPSRPQNVTLLKKEPLQRSTVENVGSTKLRKYWGGDEDPLASNDYLWSKDFMGHMKKFIQDPDDHILPDPCLSSAKEEPSGFLSLNRVMTLESLEVDFSKELAAPSRSIVENEVEEFQISDVASRRWRASPTRREQEKWDRASKATTGGSGVMLRESKRPRGDRKVLAAESREQYYKLKKRLQFLTLGIGGVGLISAYVSYSPEIAISYGAGLLGSLAYMRMLGNTVDSMADGAKGLIKGAAGQPRLLVPVVLVMSYNRWNEILVPDYGFFHLELIPMLLGFFTYKFATLFQAIEEAVRTAGEKSQA